MMFIKTQQTEEKRQHEAAVGDEHHREICVVVEQEQQARQSSRWEGEAPDEPNSVSHAQFSINDGDEKHDGGETGNIFGVHQHGRVGKEMVIEPVSECGDRPPKTQSYIVRRPPRQNAVVLHQRHVLWVAVEEKIAEDGRETARIRGVSRLVYSRRQLAWP